MSDDIVVIASSLSPLIGKKMLNRVMPPFSYIFCFDMIQQLKVVALKGV